MLFNFVAVGLAYAAAFAAAYTAPAHSTGEPSGNDIYTPGLEEAVPAGKPYTITWKADTEGPITLVFLKGPSSNAVAQYAIAEHIDNTGSYTWTPSTSLAPGKTGYGILLVDESTGAYQYSTQFGISNDAYASGATTSAAAVTKTSADAYPTTTKAAKPTTTASDDDADYYTDIDDETTSADAYPTTSAEATTTAAASLTKPTVPATTAVVTIQPSVSANSTLKTTTSSAAATRTSGPAQATGAAAANAVSFAGLVFAAGVAVLAL